MPIPIYLWTNVKKIPAEFDFTDKNDLFTFENLLRIEIKWESNLEKIRKKKYEIINNKYEKWNFYRVLELYFLPVFPLYYMWSYWKDWDKYYRREITRRWKIINHLFSPLWILVLIWAILFINSYPKISLSIIGITIISIGIFYTIKNYKRSHSTLSHWDSVVKVKYDKTTINRVDERISNCEWNMFLNDIDNITPSELSYLHKNWVWSDYKILCLDWIKEITDDVAIALSKFYHVNLWGLEKITDKQVDILCWWELKYISMSWLKTINEHQIKELQKKSLYDNFCLYNIKKFSDEQIRCLCETKWSLSIDGIKTLTDEQAKLFSNFKWVELNLYGLKNISDKQAEYLSNIECYRLYLPKIKELTDEQAKSFANFKWKNLDLLWIENITDKQAEYLSKAKCSISLNSIKSINDKQAKSFAKYNWRGGLYLWILNMTDKQAEIIFNSKYHWKIEFTFCNFTQHQLDLIEEKEYYKH